jgi:hypothetical protein
MKKFLLTSLLFFLAISLNSCELIGDIFKAGFSVGVFVVIAVIALIVFFVMRSRK